MALFVAAQSWQVVTQLAAIGQRSMAGGIPTYIPHGALLVGMSLTALIAADRSAARGSPVRDDEG